MSFRFRKFDVYQEAKEFHLRVLRICRVLPKRFSYLEDQLKRASLSVVLNIAEGSAKTSDREFRRYIGNALGSLNEIMAALEICKIENLISEDEFYVLEGELRKLTKKLGSLYKKLSQ
jgi:four helix bundle protein